MSDTIGGRLQAIRVSQQLTQAQFASALGTSAGSVAFVERDERPPSRALLQKLSDHFRISADWLLHGTGEMLLPEVPGFSGRSGKIEPPLHDSPGHGDFRFDGEEFAMVRRMDLSVSAGNGLIPVEGGEAEAMAFSRSWLLRNSINSDLAVLVRVQGDSMSPCIPDRAIVLVHVAEMRVERAGIFAFNRDGASFVKRLIPSGAGTNGRPTSIAIISDNPAYPSEVLVGNDLNQLRIIGRVRNVMFSL